MNTAIRFVAEHLRRAHPHRDLNEVFNENLTVGQRLADKVAAIGGSWSFIIGFGVFLALWALLNTVILTRHAFDPFPYIFLNLMLSMLAALQAPVIMMSQNRQAAKDRLEARMDYETNVRAEAQIVQLQEDLQALRTELLEALRPATGDAPA